MKNQYATALLSKMYAKIIFSLVFFASIVSIDSAKAQAPFCGPTFSFACSSGDLINNFSTTGGASNITNNNTGCNGNANNYIFYSALTCSQIQGQTITLNMQAGSSWSQGFRVWIDWNGNNSFADLGEDVYVSPNSATTLFTTTITVPFTAVPGVRRMRVLCRFVTVPAITDYCATGLSFGECEDYNFNVIASTPCSGSVTAGTSTTTLPSVCPTQTFALGLTGSTLASGITYQWQYSPAGLGTWTNLTNGTGITNTQFTNATVAGATSAAASVVGQTAATDYRCIVTCTSSGSTANSAQVTVGVNSFTACYCLSNATSTADEEIFNVTFGGINNSSTCATLAPGPGSILNGYSNYTTSVAPAQVLQGTAYPFSVQIGTCGGNFTNNTKIYIDYNQNGSFTDPGEQAFATAAGVAGPNFVTGNINIPLTATPGTTVMRVINVEIFSSASINPCGTYIWGETEDYLVNIIPLTPCAGSPIAGTISNATPCPNVNFTLSLIGATQAAGLTYLWQQSTNATTWVNAGSTTPSLTTAIAANTYYRCIITCTNSNISDTTVVKLISLAPFYSCYCNSAPSSNLYVDIGNVKITDQASGTIMLNNGVATPTVGNATATNGYTNFTNLNPITPLYKEKNYLFQVSQILSLSTWSTFYNATAAVWIDMNQNGVFEPNERVFQKNTSFATPTVGDTMTIPANAPIGITGMRVILRNPTVATINPCGSYTTYGETEDYLVNINYPPCTGLPDPGIATASDTAACPGYTVFLSDTTHTKFKSGLITEWMYSFDQVNWGPVPNSLNRDTMTLLVQFPNYYKLRIICANTNDTAYSNTLFVNTVLPYKCYCLNQATKSDLDSSDIGAFRLYNFILNTGGPHVKNPSAIRQRTDNTYLTPIELMADSTYRIEVYHTLKTANHADAKVTAFIDYNNSLTYEPSEKVWSGTTTASNFYISGTFKVPYVLIANKATGMRIVLNNDLSNNPASDLGCGSYTSGETEDYMVMLRRASPAGIQQTANIQEALLYPNPTADKFTVAIQAAEFINKLGLKITTATGQIVRQQNFEQVGMQFTQELSLAGLASGLYFVEINADGQKMLRKITKE
jgi:hypothetical protein